MNTRSIRSPLVVLAVLAATAALQAAMPSDESRTLPPDEDNPGIPSGDGPREPKVLFGPVPGFTTRAHPAAEPMTLPLSSEVMFSLEGLSPGQVVTWGGEDLMKAGPKSATFRFRHAGSSTIQALIMPGGRRLERKVRVEHVDPRRLTFVPSAEVVLPFDLQEAADNGQTVDAFFRPESIAALTRLGPNAYATSTRRTVVLRPGLQDKRFDAGISQLLEWRVDGEPVGVGVFYLYTDRPAGVRHLSVGPPGYEKRVDLTVYEVAVESDTPGRLPENQPVTMTARTSPPGFERDVQWLAATKYGTAEPTLGRGASFTTTFRGTFGPLGERLAFQWMGVRADDVPIGQDTKAPLVDVTFFRSGTSGVGDFECRLRFEDPLTGSVRVQEDMVCHVLDQTGVRVDDVNAALALESGQLSADVTVSLCGSFSPPIQCGANDPAVVDAVSAIDAAVGTFPLCPELAGAPQRVLAAGLGTLSFLGAMVPLPVAGAGNWTGKVHNWGGQAANDFHVTLWQFFDYDLGNATRPVPPELVEPPAAQPATLGGVAATPNPGPVKGGYYTDSQDGHLHFRGERWIEYDVNLVTPIQPCTSIDVTLPGGFNPWQVKWTKDGQTIAATAEPLKTDFNPVLSIDHLFKGHIYPVEQGSNDWHIEAVGIEAVLVQGPGTATLTPGTGGGPTKVDVSGVQGTSQPGDPDHFDEGTRLKILRTSLEPGSYWHTKDGARIGPIRPFG